MNRAAAALVVLGLAQMTGELCGIRVLHGLAAATAASPAPKVFSAARGLETFSTEFFVEWRDTSGADHSVQLTPELYSQLSGTYNRRNTYGAAVAYAPIFADSDRARPMLAAIGRYALCGNAPLLREFGIDPQHIDGPVRIRLVPLATTDPGDLLLEFTAPCS
jgi:hypothetical protein